MDEDQSLLNALQDGATLITPNNRLSHQLLQAFFTKKKALASSFFQKPACFSYKTFLRTRFKKVHHCYPNQTHPVLLSDAQCQHIWQRILVQTIGECNQGLVEQLKDAWIRCQQWRIDCTERRFSNTPQTNLFQHAYEMFENTLKKAHAITDEHVANYLISHPLVFNNLSTFYWVCFDDYTPEQRFLQHQLRTLGYAQLHYDLPSKIPSRYYYAAQDSMDEKQMISQWAKQQLAQGYTHIGIVIPDLESEASLLQRHFQRHFLPHQFNLSLGKPLAKIPLIAHGFVWLQLNQHHINNHDARLLLHSPFLKGAESEWASRVETMQTLPLLKKPQLALPSFIHALKKSTPLLSSLLCQLNAYPQHASPYAWVMHFKTRFEQLGFPGEKTLDSLNYQAFQRFLKLLDEYQQIATVSPLMSQEEALRTLYQLANATIFQGKTPDAPIQIMGFLEAAGSRFQRLWISGLTDQCLPKHTRYSPFIPLAVQKEYAMPHALLEREWQLAKTALTRLESGSDVCIFSYPLFQGEVPQRPSPLLRKMPMLQLAPPPFSLRPTQRISYQESYSLPLLSNEQIQGGTTLVANQAKCPFRAFAAHRLHAKASPIVTEDLDATERGQLMHRIMEQLWQHLQNQQHLLAMEEGELAALIHQTIHLALTPFIQTYPLLFPPLIKTLEIKRLHALVYTCLAWEKERPPFRVDALEKAFEYTLAGLPLRVRVDRLDITNDNHAWVIDYKSRLPLQKPWNEDRPEAPQLLFYALLDARIHTLLFLELQAGQLRCAGLSETEQTVAGITTLKKDEQWQDKKNTWHQQLSCLVEEFKQGHCPPKPTKENTCEQCEFQSLCRIKSMGT